LLDLLPLPVRIYKACVAQPGKPSGDSNVANLLATSITDEQS